MNYTTTEKNTSRYKPNSEIEKIFIKGGNELSEMFPHLERN